MIWITGLLGCSVIIPATAAGGCERTMQTDAEIHTCAFNVKHAMPLTSADDLLTWMCSPEGKQKLDCFFKHAEQCPDLIDPASSRSSEYYGIGAMLGQFGGKEQMCAVFDGPCSNVPECVAEKPKDLRMPVTTPFSLVPVMIYNACGPIKASLECLEALRDQCPEQVVMTLDVLQDGISSTMHVAATMNLTVVKGYINSECSRIPQGLSSNTCVRRKLESSEFKECNDNFKQTDTSSNCKAYLNTKKCVEDHVEKCLEGSAGAIIHGARVFLKGVPQDCDVITNNKAANTGGSDGISSTITTLIIASFSLFL